MAFPKVITALVLCALALAKVDPSASQVVKGRVSCNDCTQHTYDFSGIKVSAKCEGVKKINMATTEENGTFKVDIPFDYTKSPSTKCHVQLLGGPNQIYGSVKGQVTQIVKAKEEENSYIISTPLSFFKSCPQDLEYCKDANMFGSFKTFDFPLPPEWGLAPSSYYFPFPFPFFPIIGIP